MKRPILKPGDQVRLPKRINGRDTTQVYTILTVSMREPKRVEFKYSRFVEGMGFSLTQWEHVPMEKTYLPEEVVRVYVWYFMAPSFVDFIDAHHAASQSKYHTDALFASRAIRHTDLEAEAVCDEAMEAAK